MKTTALIVAAGSGRRMGSDLPKAYLPLAGVPLLTYSLELFARHPAIDAIVVVVPQGMVDETRRLTDGIPRVSAVTEGGALRVDSVRRGFERIESGAGDDDLVLVHDAARPLASPELVSAVIDAAKRTGAAVPGLRPTDTVRETAAGPVPGGPSLAVRRIDRDRLVLVQTPQGFRVRLLAEALKRADAAALPGDATDDAALIEMLGHSVAIVEGSPINFKITRSEDLKMAEGWLA